MRYLASYVRVISLLLYEGKYSIGVAACHAELNRSVILSVAKNLTRWVTRIFAVTQNDTRGRFVSLGITNAAKELAMFEDHSDPGVYISVEVVILLLSSLESTSNPPAMSACLLSGASNMLPACVHFAWGGS